MNRIRQKNLFVQFLWLLRNRPMHVMSCARAFALFQWARMNRVLFPNCLPGVALGKNVRIQNNSSVMAEAPSARVKLGDHSVVYENAVIEAYGSGTISIGGGAILGDIKVISRVKIEIGERFLSSWNVFIQDYDSHPSNPRLRSIQVRHMAEKFRPRFDGGVVSGALRSSELEELEGWGFPGTPIRIGDDVWVGANVSILKGAVIGDGCIVATGAVVLAGDYPARSIIAGNPATVVKSLGSDTPLAQVEVSKSEVVGA